MAIFTPGALIGAISGNLAGVNFVQAKHGAVLRKRQAGVHHATKAQLKQRTLFRTAQNAWNDLTEEERRAWRKAAPAFPVRNRLGHPSPYSGFQYFHHVKLLTLFHFALPFTTPPPLPRPSPYVSLELTFTAGGTYDVDVVAADEPSSPMFVLFASRPMTQKPITTFPFWRWIKSQLIPVFPINVQPDFDAILGPPGQGETIGVRAINFSPSGNASFPFETKTTML